MNKIHRPHQLVLGLSPSTHGYGFTVFEGRESLVDWGAVTIIGDNKNAQCLIKIAVLLNFYLPDVVVIEDVKAKGSRRSPRIRELMWEIKNVAKRKNLTTRAFSRGEVRDRFAYSGAKNKHQVACVIAQEFPELAPRCPPERKPWMSEDYRMSIFDAASLVLTYFEEEETQRMNPADDDPL